MSTGIATLIRSLGPVDLRNIRRDPLLAWVGLLPFALALVYRLFVPWLRDGPGQLVGTSLRTEIDYQVPRYGSPTFIVVGNEAQGLPQAYEQECDLLVKMPMLGKADSLNAAVATAVMAYEVLNQRRAG